jgi:glucosyl-3-phosphoglycerate synthase
MKIVVPILNPNMAEDLVNLAIALAGQERDRTGYAVLPQITVLGVATVPEETPLSQAASLVKAYRTLFRYIPPENNERAEVKTEVRVAREVWQGIVDEVKEQRAGLLLLYWKGFTQTTGKVYGATIDALMEKPPCDMVLARMGHLPPLHRILVPVRTSGYSALAMKLAENLAEEYGSQITVMHSIPPNTRNPFPQDPEDDNPLQSIIGELPPGAKSLIVPGHPVETIVEKAPDFDAVIVGAGTHLPNVNQSESMARRLAADISQMLIVVKSREPLNLKGNQPEHPAGLSERVDRWFAQNTFHYREFRTMSSLGLHKEQNQIGVSLIFPVYATLPPIALGDTVRRARLALMQETQLVDEIIVSLPKGMYEVHDIELMLDKARNGADIRIVEYPSEYQGHGMGAAIWHALPETRGDLVAWADLTYQHFEARHIYGLLGTLLTYSDFELATGFFSEEGQKSNSPSLHEAVRWAVRPLLSALFPDLAGIIDPLCTAGAAKRDLLDSLSFYTGLGFNVGLLMETVRRENLMAIAQVDLGSAGYGQTQPDAQVLINEAMAVLLRRVGEITQHPQLPQLLDLSAKTIGKDKETGTYSLKVSPILAPEELPPHVWHKGYSRPSF